MATSSTPENFPIPADVEGFWAWEKGHFPRPATPVTQELMYRGLAEGFSSAMDQWSCPFGVKLRTINYYGFLTLNPFDLGSEAIEDRIDRYKRKMEEQLPQLGLLWEKTWLPSILPALEKGRTAVYSNLNNNELLTAFEDVLKGFYERLTIHGWINYSTIAASWFADFYNETFEPEESTEAYQLLQGFPTCSLVTARGLWRLSRMIKKSGELTTAFEEQDPSDLMSHLEGFEDGRNFLVELNTYLDEFGWRSEAFEIADQTWREDPTVPLNTLQGYIALGEDADPDVHFNEAVRTREQLLEQARQRLADKPERLERFNELYEMGRHNLVLTDDHNFYIDQIGTAILRPPLLEMGRRLVLGNALENENDVFMLYQLEIQEGLSGVDQRPLAAQRKSEIEKWSGIIPPPFIGEPPPPTDDPWEEAMLHKMLGVPPEPSQDPNIITGTAASPGTVQGPAKVVRTLAEASKVKPGDVLVCELTMPPWTPLFSTVSAVVTDTGGVLSHSAVVAREYRLPCVVGTIIGTAVIEDGMILTVDGSKGLVRIDSR